MARADPRYADAIQRALVEVGAGGRRRAPPKWSRGRRRRRRRSSARSVDETRAFAMQALQRRLKVIGLAAAAGRPRHPDRAVRRARGVRPDAARACSGPRLRARRAPIWRVLARRRPRSSCSCWPGWSAVRGAPGTGHASSSAGRWPSTSSTPTPLHRVAPRGRASSAPADRRAGPPQSFAVRPCAWRPTRATRRLPDAALGAPDPRRWSAQYPGFLWRGDGRVNINQQPGYQIVFQARIGGHTTYGKRVLLVGRTRSAAAQGARHHDALRALAGDPASRRGRRPTARSRPRFARCASAPSGRSA